MPNNHQHHSGAPLKFQYASIFVVDSGGANNKNNVQTTCSSRWTVHYIPLLLYWLQICSKALFELISCLFPFFLFPTCLLMNCAVQVKWSYRMIGTGCRNLKTPCMLSRWYWSFAKFRSQIWAAINVFPKIPLETRRARFACMVSGHEIWLIDPNGLNINSLTSYHVLKIS